MRQPRSAPPSPPAVEFLLTMGPRSRSTGRNSPLLGLPAAVAYTACMNSSRSTQPFRQYTLRRVPRRLDEALRHTARAEGKTLNQVTLEALERGAGLGSEAVVNHAFDDLAGTWIHDPECERLLEEMRDQIDRDLWK